MNIQELKITQIKVNGDNPRSITSDKFNKLVNSILVFPKMLRLRPIVIDKMFTVIGGNMRLNREIKKPFIMKMEQACKEQGMRFYVSDAHFKERCNNGSCCGLPPEWDYSRGQWCEALQIAKKNGTVRFAEVQKDVDQLLNFEFVKAHGFNLNSTERQAQFANMKMSDYMRYLWNNPQCGQSPYKLFYGVIKPTGTDENGDLIYQYDNAKTY